MLEHTWLNNDYIKILSYFLNEILNVVIFQKDGPSNTNKGDGFLNLLLVKRTPTPCNRICLKMFIWICNINFKDKANLLRTCNSTGMFLNHISVVTMADGGCEYLFIFRIHLNLRRTILFGRDHPSLPIYFVIWK
jgi:hypothetical protein